MVASLTGYSGFLNKRLLQSNNQIPVRLKFCVRPEIDDNMSRSSYPRLDHRHTTLTRIASVDPGERRK
jgi:hypothetical protein